MSSPDWTPEPKPVPPELEPTFEHAVYPPERVHFVPLQEKLTGNEWAALKAYAQQASIGEPDAHT